MADGMAGQPAGLPPWARYRYRLSQDPSSAVAQRVQTTVPVLPYAGVLTIDISRLKKNLFTVTIFISSFSWNSLKRKTQYLVAPSAPVSRRLLLSFLVCHLCLIFGRHGCRTSTVPVLPLLSTLS